MLHEPQRMLQELLLTRRVVLVKFTYQINMRCE